MQDRFGRTINYLRVSITDHCPLKCLYCVRKEDIAWKKHGDILSYEEIEKIVRTAAGLGFRKVRLTGGEPLARRGVCDLVRMLSRVSGIDDLALTTNGILLERHATDLKSAGLSRINISLDTLDADRYRTITGGGELGAALAGIEAALKAGLNPVKLNCVILPGINDEEADRLTAFGAERGIEVRFIQRMKFDEAKPRRDDEHLHASRPPDCAGCNRLRVTADGLLKPCLLSSLTVPLRTYGDNIEGAIRQAISDKPERGIRLTGRSMMAVGG